MPKYLRGARPTEEPEAPEPCRRGLDGEALPPPTGVETYTEPAKEHSWGTSGHGRPQPDWLNDGSDGGGGGRTCSVCGVTEVTMIRADQAGMDFVYRDALGNMIQSMSALPCPIFLGDPNGAIMDGRVKIRGLTGRMDGVEGRQDKVEERLTAIEAENESLREQLDTKLQLDVTSLVEWLGEMAVLHAKQQLGSVPVMVGKTPLALPEPVADLIIEMGKKGEPFKVVREREKVLRAPDKGEPR